MGICWGIGEGVIGADIGLGVLSGVDVGDVWGF